MKRTVGGPKWEYGTEQPAKFYDNTFENATHWKSHYTYSHYYPLWTVIADRVRRAGIRRVLDIGCGPGQVASLLRDKGVPEYLGVDFSPVRIQQARAVCPEYNFVVADVFNTDLLEEYQYDCVLVMEFLEHIQRDLEVIKAIKAGTRVIGTVPNFTAAGHVRYFGNHEEVHQRYRFSFESLCVDEHCANARGKKYFILEGIR